MKPKSLFCKRCKTLVKPKESGFGNIGGLVGNKRYTCSICGEDLETKKLFTLFSFIFISLFIIFVLALNASAYNSIVNINTSQNVGVIRSDFYGISIPTTTGLTKYDNVTDGMSCIRNVTSNYSYAQSELISASLSNIRFNLNTEAVKNDMSLYASGWERTINSEIDKIKFAYDNNFTVTLIAGYMPSWLSNATTGWCLSASSNSSCSPTNYTKWGEVVLVLLNNVTNNGQYNRSVKIEVWNEPHGTSWLNNLSTDNMIKSREYNKLYNATYTAVKSVYPNMKVIGLGGADAGGVVNGEEILNSNITKNFFSNFSNVDEYSLHYYYGSVLGKRGAENLSWAIEQYKNLCAFYGNNYCNNIALNELNTYSIGTLVFNLNYSTGTSTALTQALMSNITNVALYTYGSSYLNTSCDSSTSNYSIWNQFSGRTLAYNITKLFATNHKSGNTVLISNSTNQSLKVVSSKDSNNKIYITLTNTLNENATINITKFADNIYLRDNVTGQNYTSSNNIYQITLTPYEVKQLNSESYNITLGFSRLIGKVRGDFYGVNTHGNFLSDNLTTIDINNDGSREGVTNQTWHRTYFEKAKLSTIRIDMSLDLWTNNSDGTYNMPSYLEKNKDSIRYIRSLGGKVVLVAGRMPISLQNVTAQCTADNKSCGANNWTRYGDLLMKAFNYYTNNGEWNSSVEVEPWNEPFDHFLLEGTPTTNYYNRSELYQKIHNVTYTRIKAQYPNVPIVANIFHFGYANADVNSYKPEWIMANLSSQIDAISVHLYDDNNLSLRLINKMPVLLANCSLYNVNCSNIIFSEWNVYNDTLKNNSYLDYSNKVADFYSTIINYYPSNVTSIFYEWASLYHYGIYYTNPWSMVSEPQLDNRLFASFATTSNFTRYMPSNSNIYESNVSNDKISIVSSQIGNTKNFILINKENNQKDLPLTILPSGLWIKVNDGTLINSDGVNPVNLGIMNNYSVDIWTQPNVVKQEGDLVYYNYWGEELFREENPDPYVQSESLVCSVAISSLGKLLKNIGVIVLGLIFGVILYIIFTNRNKGLGETFNSIETGGIDLKTAGYYILWVMLIIAIGAVVVGVLASICWI